MSRWSRIGTRSLAFAAALMVAPAAMAQFPPDGPPPGGPDGPPPGFGQGRGEGRGGRGFGGEGGPGGPGGRMGGMMGMMPPNPVVSALDTDADGTISEKELAAAATSLKTLDKNKDGKLTQDELRPNFGGMRGPGGPGGNSQALVTDLVNTLLASDKDKDGKLSREELPARQRTLMDRADTNKDKFLDKAELTRYAENRVRSQMQNQGGFGGGEGGRGGRGGRGGFGGGEGFGPPPGGGEGFGPPPGGGRPPRPDGPDQD